MKYILIIKLKKCFFLPFLILTQLCVNAQNDIRKIEELNNNWLFINQDIADGAKNNLDEKNWQTVTVPHDWAINQPFNRNNDIQIVKVGEDGETKASERTGRTGGLPYQGVGWYRKHLKINSVDKGKDFSIEFDGAMSHAKVYLNDKFVGTWPYGYSSFHFDITKYLKWGG
jgi:beta-galactosidase